ncbi:MAG: response regulator [gamma proteobacterium symbiont of Taylorina sp.]|nr:response regulator [gamma proteobacterium symbiont of Taylorina sp.]
MPDMKTMRDKLQGLHVLVVDDEEAVLDGSLQFMKKFFNKVDTAIDGEEALRMFKEYGHYNVVFTDIKMPKSTGWELIQAIRSIDNDVYIAAMTGSPELGTDELIALCDSYLRKPVNIENMTHILEKLSDRQNI